MELFEKQCILSDRIIEEYVSQASADAFGSALIREYRQAKESYVKREGRLLAKQFKVEWKEFFENGGVESQGMQEPTPSIPEAGPSDDLVDAAEKR